MSLPRPSPILALVLVLLVGCSASPPSEVSATGTVQLAVATPAALPADVSRVTVTVSGSDMASRSLDLAVSNGAWGGILGDLPAGAHRTFLVQAFSASGTLRYEGRAEDVTITAGTRGLLTLTLQDVIAPVPSSNAAPIISSLRLSSTRVAPGGSIQLTTAAFDPNAGDEVTLAWSAPSGSFTAPTQETTDWIAPGIEGLVPLTLTVTDPHGAALSMRVPVNVARSPGAEEVEVSFNTTPRIESFSAQNAFVDVGQQVSLSLTATDADGDALSYEWSATCPGSFSGAGTSHVTFTPSARPVAACNNCWLSVRVRDGRGGECPGYVFLCVAAPLEPNTNTHWSVTGAMQASHFGHQLLPLANGKVLAVGGDPIAFNVTELYDPGPGTWSYTGSLPTSNRDGSALVLADGRVLLTGGAAYDNISVRAAQLYDPAKGTWSATGSLLSARQYHTATLLPSGKVLVVGGSTHSQDDALATAELYDPATGTWSPTGSLKVARLLHTATLLKSGKVLVTGGESVSGNTFRYLNEAEVYDPATGSWSSTPLMRFTRVRHTATRLADGRVLLVGGNGGGDDTEVYDPATGTWDPTGAPSQYRIFHTATLLPDGKVLITGGGSYNLLTSAEVYDPATGTWSPAGYMSRSRSYHAAVLLSTGQVLISGGFTEDAYGATVADLYTP